MSTEEQKLDLSLEDQTPAQPVEEVELNLQLEEEVEDKLTPEDIKSILEAELGVEIKTKKDLEKAKEAFNALKTKLPDSPVQEEFVKRLKELQDDVDTAIQSFGYFDPRKDPSATNRKGEYFISDDEIVQNNILSEVYQDYQEENGIKIDKLTDEEREKAEEEIIERAKTQFEQLKLKKTKYERYATEKRKAMIEAYNEQKTAFESQSYKKAKELAIQEKARIEQFKEVSTKASEQFKTEFSGLNTIQGVKLTQGSVDQIVNIVSDEIREGQFVKNILEGMMKRIENNDLAAKEELMELIIMNHKKIPTTFRDNFKRKKSEINKVETIKEVAVAAKNIVDPAKRPPVTPVDKEGKITGYVNPEDFVTHLQLSGKSIAEYIK